MIMKIVVDTNVILAALMSQKGVSNKFLVWLFKNKTKVNIVSNTLVTEYEAVILRDDNLVLYPQFSKEELRSFVDDVCLISHHQKINFLWRPYLKDYKDDMVLETAFNGNADYIVTYNSKDFQNVYENFKIKIFTPKEFLELVGEIK